MLKKLKVMAEYFKLLNWKVVAEYLKLLIAVMGVSGTIIFIFIVIVTFAG